MTMAKWQPPKTAREFRFWISQHAVERFRERGLEPELTSRTDRDVAMLLDERIYHAIVAKQQTDVIDSEMPDVDTKVVKIENRKGAAYYVVMRPYRPNAYPPMRVVGGPEGLAQAAITVLTEEMASTNFTTKRWYVPNRPFASKLQLVKPAPPKSEPAPTPVSPPPTQVAEESTRRRGSTVERHEFAKRILRERPHITSNGADGLSALVEKEFGVGMSYETIAKLREVVESERAATPRPTSVIEPTPAPPPAPPPVHTPIAAHANIAMQFAQAIEAEKTAKQRVNLAASELADAQSVLDGATSQVEKLLAQMQSQRA